MVLALLGAAEGVGLAAGLGAGLGAGEAGLAACSVWAACTPHPASASVKSKQSRDRDRLSFFIRGTSFRVAAVGQWENCPTARISVRAPACRDAAFRQTFQRV